jgi:hypothetical protein
MQPSLDLHSIEEAFAQPISDHDLFSASLFERPQLSVLLGQIVVETPGTGPTLGVSPSTIVASTIVEGRAHYL